MKAVIKTLRNLEAERLNYFHTVKCSNKLLGSLSTNDGNGCENVHLELNLHCRLLQTLMCLFHLFQNVKCWQTFLGLNSKGLYRSSGKQKESCCLVFSSSTKREIRQFQVIVVQ